MGHMLTRNKKITPMGHMLQRKGRRGRRRLKKREWVQLPRSKGTQRRRIKRMISLSSSTKPCPKYVGVGYMSSANFFYFFYCQFQTRVKEESCVRYVDIMKCCHNPNKKMMIKGNNRKWGFRVCVKRSQGFNPQPELQKGPNSLIILSS